MKQYYWAEDLENYKSDNEPDYNQVIQIKRLNFFIGRNNAGKSRFLRSLFTNQIQIKWYQDLNFLKVVQIIENKIITLKNDPYSTINSDVNHCLKELRKELLKDNSHQIIGIYKNLLNMIDSKIALKTHFSALSSVSVEDSIEAIDQEKLNSFSSKFYIPTLRGMRPTSNQDGSTPYIDRTIKDYFTVDKERGISSTNVISGECLFYELTRCLLGEPNERELIRKYEQKLSQYFFDNQTISLIPKYKDDVVYIKIGEDQQFPIYELGDGLQQAIILTYEAFIKKNETHAFFIEEPELHMHAGMVRQLMNFYLNETKHYYFFTTHSNHLLDMIDESDDVIIQKFSKNPDGSFQINRCDKDRDLLASLGVKPSSVYLANCTIWVEGITDRLYITKYMQKYLANLKTTNNELYKKYLRFMPNYHYTFVEYAGSNLTHWNFDDDYTNGIEDNGLNALAVCSSMLLLADGDIQSKGNRVSALIEQLTQENFLLLECKEIENTLPENIIIATAKDKFSRMKSNTTHGFDISVLDSISGKLSFYHSRHGIGKILDNSIRLPNAKGNYCFSDRSGTIKEKLKFCRLILSKMDNEEWQLTPSAINICEKIFTHIEKCNQ